MYLYLFTTVKVFVVVDQNITVVGRKKKKEAKR